MIRSLIRVNMQPFQVFLKKRENIVTLIVSLVLVGFIAFLLVTNYKSQVKLRASALERLVHDIDKRAASLNYFFSERNNDLKSLTAGREIRTFFENQALGMSMNYGLRTSLIAVSKSLQQFVTDKTVGGKPIYSYALLVDHLGNSLADSQALAADRHPAKNWKSFLTPESPEGKIVVIGSKILMSAPYFFRNQYAGQILARIVTQSVYDHLVKMDESQHQYVGIVSGDDNYFSPEDLPMPLLNWGLSELRKLKDGSQHRFQLTVPNGAKTEMMAVRTGVNDTPFSVVSVLPAAEVFGRSAPRQLLITLIILAIAFIGGFVLVWRMNIQKLVLRAQLAETARKEKTIAEKNRALIKENRERRQAEIESKKAKKAAEVANLAKSDFLANMCHELRTPLNHIIGFTEMVVDKQIGELTEMQQEYLNDVLDSGRHLLSLINDILDISKVESGKLELQPSEMDLKALLENSLTMVREKAMKHGIGLSLDIGSIPETLTADERKLKQILYNLLANAVKFTPDGGSVGVKACLVENSEVQLPPQAAADQTCAAVSAGEFIKVVVTDTGIGLIREDLDRIFDPFDQVENSISRRFAGTGLGLSLTKSLVALHGGTIWAESEGLGKGSRFTFVTPVFHKN
jgi:signal transduction histidine kinase